MSIRPATRGFSLIELLIVASILAALALSALALVNTADEQFRYDDTKARLESIRTAVLGLEDTTLNGQLMVSGFVSDIGRLPNNLQELIEQGAMPSWVLDVNTRVGAGWRGPYLAVLPDIGGLRSYPDGWGNPGGPPNHGWAAFTPGILVNPVPDDLAQTLLVQSFGSDGLPGGTQYAADYPAAGANLIVGFDHQLNLRNWQVTIVFDNQTNRSAPNRNVWLRVRLHYPQEGSMAWPAAWPGTQAARDAAPYLTERFRLRRRSVARNSTMTVNFDFGSVDKFIPWGERSLGVVRDDNGDPYNLLGQSPELVTLAPRTPLPSLSILWPIRR